MFAGEGLEYGLAIFAHPGLFDSYIVEARYAASQYKGWQGMLEIVPTRHFQERRNGSRFQHFDGCGIRNVGQAYQCLAGMKTVSPDY